MERLFTIEIRENAQLIAESMPGAAFVFCDDPEEHIVYANEMMWKIVGCDSLEEYMEFTAPLPDYFLGLLETFTKQE